MPGINPRFLDHPVSNLVTVVNELWLRICTLFYINPFSCKDVFLSKEMSKLTVIPLEH
jgi:hypothetical protein